MHFLPYESNQYIVKELLLDLPQTLNLNCKDLPALTLVSKSIDIKAPVDTVFTYFARPEHVSDQLKDQERVGMTVIPMDIKEGMGVGTTFRIIGD
ncbi:uncharacterized protein METZ01_LOCUS506441, partial [marine metagenome]